LDTNYLYSGSIVFELYFFNYVFEDQGINLATLWIKLVKHLLDVDVTALVRFTNLVMIVVHHHSLKLILFALNVVFTEGFNKLSLISLENYFADKLGDSLSMNNAENIHLLTKAFLSTVKSIKFDLSFGFNLALATCKAAVFI